MSTSLVAPRKRGRSIDRLTAGQRMWCEEMAADPQFNATAAARKAGYKAPPQAAQKMLKNEIVMGFLGKVLHDRQKRCRITADEVMEHLRQALFLDPMDLFDKTPAGTFIIKDLDQVPVEVRRCITKIKTVVVELPRGGTETRLEIELMSKDSAMTNTLKHLGLTQPDNSVSVNVTGARIDFDELCRPPQDKDVVEGRIVDGK